MKTIINYFRKYPYVLIMFLVMFVWGTVNTIEANKYSTLLDLEGKYTIAVVNKIEGANSGRWIRVEFEFNKRRYISETKNERIPQSWIGEKILIKFLPSKPVVFKLYDDIDVPDSLIKLMPRVWDSLPVKNER